MFDLTRLNKAQAQAVSHGEGPLLLLAGPGSGKTYTIVQRIRFLVEERKVPAEQILVITFTKDAARSMQNRFRQSTSIPYPVNFGTFHAIFYHLLRASGRYSHSIILQTRQKQNLIFPILKQYLPSGSDWQELSLQFLEAISYYKNTDEWEASMRKIPQEYREHFPEIYRAYETTRKKTGMDFDDMLSECEQLLTEDETFRTRWQERFSHILIDEFQDINQRQYRIIKILAEKHKNVFAVGDDDQAIYGFRGARPQCMRQFQEEFAARQLCLEINYRSHPGIIEAAVAVIGENPDRFAKKQHAAGSRQNVEDRAADAEQRQSVHLGEFPEYRQQMQYLTERLKNADPQETQAVLFRTNLAMQNAANILTRAGISFQMKEQAGDLHRHFIAQDILAYLRIAAGENRKTLYLRILNRPQRNVGREAVEAACVENGVDLERLKACYAAGDVFLPENVRIRICGELEKLGKQLLLLKNISPAQGVRLIRNACGYEGYLRQKAGRNAEKWQEWEDIMEWLKEEAEGYATIPEWLAAIETDGIVRSRKQMRESPENTRLQLMTVHASKGLEFDRVWIPDCNEKTYPHGDLTQPGQLEEERRLFYVAMTRAKKDLELLCLTGTRERPRFPSRFLIPLNPYRR